MVPVLYWLVAEEESKLTKKELDYRAYHSWALQVLSSESQLRAALTEGGIIWRIILELMSSTDGVLQVPSDLAIRAPILSRAEPSFSDILPAEGKTSFIDNTLTTEEADILCGLCRVSTSNVGMNTGLWNPWNGEWFQQRLQAIREGTAQPLQSKSVLRKFINTGRQFCMAVLQLFSKILLTMPKLGLPHLSLLIAYQEAVRDTLGLFIKGGHCAEFSAELLTCALQLNDARVIQTVLCIIEDVLHPESCRHRHTSEAI
ncbi:hypothetical protein L226DRAFT_567825 [Lentinus tigrinus ALCF2SS1-7]|uniref:uncharacterized protein n=1 Tax=Lentinus tigrinus ALCF2SS1-7 TaxID=1328758 RepID=UPI0011661CDC|nr:hypothetical protein L226DRAFT_567825 [Lentinus tigrinus ALCF2SS1-7]